MDLFAKRLRERAAELGISNAEAARRSGLSERRYGHYVSGLREPDLATLVRISAALLTTPNKLLGFDELADPPARSLIVDRLISASQTLSDEVLEILVIQTEALVRRRKGNPAAVGRQR